jgi:hypothetical protein
MWLLYIGCFYKLRVVLRYWIHDMDPTVTWTPLWHVHAQSVTYRINDRRKVVAAKQEIK